MNFLSWFKNKNIFWGLYAFVILSWVIFSICDYLFLGFRTWDTAAHVQPVIHWVKYGNYADQMMVTEHPFVNHFRPALLLLAPLFKLWPTMLVIHLAKIFIFALCPLIFLSFGKKFNLGKIAYAIPCLWLVQDVLITTLYAENQATGLTLALVVLAFMLAINKSYKWMFFPLVFMVFFKENMALVWLCIGMFIIVEQRKYRLGSLIFALGLIIGLSTYFIIIPSFSSGIMQHKAAYFDPFGYIPSKILMLFRAYMAMGFFVYFRPQALLYTLPAYGLFLVGGYGARKAFYLSMHTHDVPTTILFCAAFYLVLKTHQNQSRFNFKYKPHRVFLKTFLIISLLFWFAKSPYINIASRINSFKTAIQIKNTSHNLKDSLDPNQFIYVHDYLMDVFIDLKNIYSFDSSKGNDVRPFISNNPFMLVFTTHPKFARLNFINTILPYIKEHHKKGFCDLKIYNEGTEALLYVATYFKPLPQSEKNSMLNYKQD